MEFKNRKAQYPGRVKLVKVPGSTDLYDMTLADGSVSGSYTAGTPLNADTFNAMLKEISAEIENSRLTSIKLADDINEGEVTYISDDRNITVKLPKSFYYWEYSSRVGEDAVITLSKTQHGLNKVKGAILVPRSHVTSSGELSGFDNFAEKDLKYGIKISNDTVYVALDVGVMLKGFYCLVYGD